MSAPIIERIRRHGYVVEGECHLWTGYRDPAGYGRLGQVLVHRAVLAASLGRDLKAGEVARHACDRPSCINPAHLLPGSQADNNRDARERGRHVSPTGDRRTASRLTLEQARTIKRRRLAGEGARALGREYGVAHTTVLKIASGELWVQA